MIVIQVMITTKGSVEYVILVFALNGMERPGKISSRRHFVCFH